MTEQRVNGLGQVVEYNAATDRWVPVKEDVTHVESTETSEVILETSEVSLTPTEDKTLADEDDDAPRRTRRARPYRTEE